MGGFATLADPYDRPVPAVDRRRIAAWLLVVYLAVVAFVVFWPSAAIASSSVAWAHHLLQSIGAPRWVTPSSVEFVLNVALFVPLSFLGSRLVPRWPVRAWVALGFAASLAIELGQLAVLPGRSSTGYDVLANSLGALVGAVVAELRNPD